MGDTSQAFTSGESGLPVGRIGPYRILRVLGEGGMGVVYEAEQSEPIHRRVALKIVRAEVSSQEVLARFDIERQALALMTHESIAQVLDAGTTEAGRPWFAMEMVRGIPMTDYCDAERLTTKERAALFIPVCLAVQHAHQKGVIHRDLKPSNVLVTEKDGRPVPKIIDFGVAKALGHRLTEKSLVTMFGQAMGTPAYMSPEQAEMSGLDVDTRTDVYSLGVMLYELLVGRLPEDPGESGLQSFMVRLANRATNALRPSAKLSALTGERKMLAALRGTSADMLYRQLRGDLDWIVMKAMELDRNRRYETANGLAMDIGRYLADEPIQAGPPSTSYRARKFIRRHKGGVVAAFAVTMALLGGATATTVGFIRASRAQARAMAEAATAEQVSNFLTGLFTLSVPDRATAAAITAREILDTGASRIDKELASQPLVQSRLMQTIGIAYHQLGLYAESERLLRQSLATRERLLRPDAPEVSGSLTSLGYLLTSQGRYADAETTLTRALRLTPRSEGDGRLQRASAASALAELYLRKGRYVEAETLLTTAVADFQAALGAENGRVADVVESLAKTMAERGKPAAAESLHRRVLLIRERILGPDHRFVAQVLSNLASSLVIQGRLAEAEPLYQRALAIETKVYGPTHSVVAVDLYNLGNVAGDLGKHSDAIELLERAKRIWQTHFGPDHPYVAAALANMGEQYTATGRVRLAIPLLQRALAIQEKKLAPSNSFIATTRYDLGEAYRRLQQFAESKRYLRLALEGREKGLDPSSHKIAESLAALARLDRDEGKLADAAQLFDRATAQWKRSGRPYDDKWTSIVHDYADVLRRLGRVSDATALLNEREKKP